MGVWIWDRWALLAIEIEAGAGGIGGLLGVTVTGYVQGSLALPRLLMVGRTLQVLALLAPGPTATGWSGWLMKGLLLAL